METFIIKLAVAVIPLVVLVTSINVIVLLAGVRGIPSPGTGGVARPSGPWPPE